MKSTAKILSLGVLLFGVVAIALAEEGNRYTSRYDSVDVDMILSNDRILNNYIKCLMDEGPCTPEGKELKKTLPDALKTGCTKCNEKQKTTAEKVMNHLVEKRPKDWDRLTKKYDPEGIAKKRYEELQSKEKAQ